MHQRVEVVDFAAPDGVDEALDQTAMEGAHELGMLLGELAERAVREADESVVTVVDAGDGRVEAQGVELTHERLEARRRLEVGAHP